MNYTYKTLTELRQIAKENGVKYVNRKDEESLLEELNALEETQEELNALEETQEDFTEDFEDESDEFEEDFTEDLILTTDDIEPEFVSDDYVIDKITGVLTKKEKTMHELIKEAQELNKKSEAIKNAEMKKNLLREAKRNEQLRKAGIERFHMNQKRFK